MWNPQAGRPASYIGTGLCLGVAFGAAIGAALGNLAYGMGPGIALGVALGAVLQKRNAAQVADRDQHGDSGSNGA